MAEKRLLSVHHSFNFIIFFCLTQHDQKYSGCLDAWMSGHPSYVYLRVAVGWTEACVLVPGAGEWEQAIGKVLCLACSWGPSGLSLQPPRLIVSLLHNAAALMVTRDLGTAMFSLLLEDDMPLKKILQPLGLLKPFQKTFNYSSESDFPAAVPKLLTFS